MSIGNNQNVDKSKILIYQTNSKNYLVISNKKQQGATSALR